MGVVIIEINNPSISLGSGKAIKLKLVFFQIFESFCLKFEFLFQSRMESKHVVTPQPTPKSSPVISPVHIHSPLATPTGSPRITTPQKISIFDYTQATNQESEPETSLSLNINEELKKVAGLFISYMLLRWFTRNETKPLRL